jgi:hypothetical protein
MHVADYLSKNGNYWVILGLSDDEKSYKQLVAGYQKSVLFCNVPLNLYLFQLIEFMLVASVRKL